MTNGTATLASELVLVDQTGDSVWHNGGGMFFHSDQRFFFIGPTATTSGRRLRSSRTNCSPACSASMSIKRGGSISHPIPRQPNLGTTANYYISKRQPIRRPTQRPRRILLPWFAQSASHDN